MGDSNQPIIDELLDKDAARKALGNIGNTKFYALLGSGEIRACKIGRRTFVRRSEISRYISTLPTYTPLAGHNSGEDQTS